MNKIENPKTEVPKGLEINDKDLTNLLLTCLKNMTKNYAVALTEASNEELYKELKKEFDAISKLQRETFELIFRNGWYILEEADGAKVGEKYNQLNECFNDLDVEEE
ncbi:MAG: spore coat protein [Bacilli bacterium]|nr:spore coat protein [Bacilli bacterium]